MNRKLILSMTCVLIMSLPLGNALAQEICRTPGFWGTHSGLEKSGSTNITEEVIRSWLSVSQSYDQTETDRCTFDAFTGSASCNFEPPGPAGSAKACRDAKKNDLTLFQSFPSGLDGIEICGQVVSVLPQGVEGIPPVVEAICVSPSSDTNLQLGRQLTAAALNCLMSGGGADCSGTSIESVFGSCNTTCGLPSQADQTSMCIEKLDCFNNGGVWNEQDPGAMYCQMDVPNSCHDQNLAGTIVGNPGGPVDN